MNTYLPCTLFPAEDDYYVHKEFKAFELLYYVFETYPLLQCSHFKSWQTR